MSYARYYVPGYVDYNCHNFKSLFNMKKRKVFVRNVFAPGKDPGEKPTGPGMAVPDQSMTVQEILSRYARGLPLGGQRVPLYEDDEIAGMADVSKMDLADRQEYFENANAEISRIKTQFNENVKKQQAKKTLDAIGPIHTVNPKQPSGE